jgi:hypothetical protein
MSNDRHNPDIARTMASAVARDPVNDARREEARRDDEARERMADRQRVEDRERMDDHRQRRDDLATADDRPMAIFAGGEADGYRTQWDAIQTGFVDEPRKAVQEADELVAVVIGRLSDVFAAERTSLENQWGKGDEASTEDLRLALRKYRSFFERLLSL